MRSKIDENYILPKYYDNWHCPWQLPLCRHTFLLGVGRFHAKISQTLQNPCHPYISSNFCKRTILLYTCILSKSFIIYTEKKSYNSSPFSYRSHYDVPFQPSIFPTNTYKYQAFSLPRNSLETGTKFSFFCLEKHILT